MPLTGLAPPPLSCSPFPTPLQTRAECISCRFYCVAFTRFAVTRSVPRLLLFFPGYNLPFFCTPPSQHRGALFGRRRKKSDPTSRDFICSEPEGSRRKNVLCTLGRVYSNRKKSRHLELRPLRFLQFPFFFVLPDSRLHQGRTAPSPPNQGRGTAGGLPFFAVIAERWCYYVPSSALPSLSPDAIGTHHVGGVLRPPT